MRYFLDFFPHSWNPVEGGYLTRRGPCVAHRILILLLIFWQPQIATWGQVTKLAHLLNIDYLSIIFLSCTGQSILSAAKITVQICAMRKQEEKCFFLGVETPSYIFHALPSLSDLTLLGYSSLYNRGLERRPVSFLFWGIGLMFSNFLIPLCFVLFHMHVTKFE